MNLSGILLSILLRFMRSVNSVPNDFASCFDFCFCSFMSKFVLYFLYLCRIIITETSQFVEILFADNGLATAVIMKAWRGRLLIFSEKLQVNP